MTEFIGMDLEMQIDNDYHEGTLISSWSYPLLILKFCAP